MKVPDPFEEIRRQLERMFGYPPGSADPFSPILGDIEKLNRVLGEGFALVQSVMGPQAMLDRVEALHPDQAILGIQQAAEDIMKFPIGMLKGPPMGPNGRLRRY